MGAKNLKKPVSKARKYLTPTLQEEDGSIIHRKTKKYRFFSVERFKSEIATNSFCFYCGAKKGAKTFSEEHIIPRWILKECDLFDKKIGLPNDTDTLYSNYTLRCCKECNTFLARTFEDPISKIVKAGHKEVVKYLKRNGPIKIYSWLALIYSKTHLRDLSHKNVLDQRVDTRSIAEARYNFGHLHHAYCLARMPYAKASISLRAFGSFYVGKAAEIGQGQIFDYHDSYETCSIMLRVNDLVFIANFTDGAAAYLRMETYGPRLSELGALDPQQIREVFTHFVYNAGVLINEPTIATAVLKGKTAIVTKHKPVPIFEDNTEFLTNLTRQFQRGILGEAVANTLDYRFSCLFDENGNFREWKEPEEK